MNLYKKLLIAFLLIFVISWLSPFILNHAFGFKINGLSSYLIIVFSLLSMYFIKGGLSLLNFNSFKIKYLLQCIGVIAIFNIIFYLLNFHILQIPKNGSAFSTYTIFQLILLVSIIGPIGEELLFRGILQKSLVLYFGNKKVFPVIITSLVFGLIHFTSLLSGEYLYAVIYNVIFAFILGLISGYCKEKTNSIFPSIILHIFGNIFGTIFMTLYLKFSILFHSGHF